MSKIKVNGQDVDIDVSDDLTIQDVSDDMDRVATLMGFWGGIWAAAEAEKVEVDTFYRQWKAKYAEEIQGNEPKLAAAKITARVEAHDQFALLKKAVAKAASNVIVARTHYESFRVKANILQSKGAMYRAEYDATNMKTKATTIEEKIKAMRKSNGQGE